MNGNKRACFTLLILFLVYPAVVQAWNSIGMNNHRQITADAIDDLGFNNYPDLDMYRGTYLIGDGVVEGSADESSHVDPRTDIKYWEGPSQYWKDQANINYNAFNFTAAYDFFGYYLHLMQDSFVPPHQKKCAHFILSRFWRHLSDDFENYANNNHQYSSSTNTDWGNYDNYGHYWRLWLSDEEDDDDGDESTYDPNDSTIVDGPNDYNLTSTWGTYGEGTWPNDTIPGNDDGDDWFDGNNGSSYLIAHEQLYQAYSAVKSEVKTFSESLPPLIKNLDIQPSASISPLIDLNNGSQISFQILENRKNTVKIFITVDSPAGPSIIDSSYRTGKSFILSAGANLPWEGSYSISWDGTLEDGTYPSDGEHTLYVQIEDEDGNISSASSQLFTIYKDKVLTISRTGNGTVTSDVPGIDCGDDCSDIYAYDETVTLTASPDNEWTFTGWSGGGCSGTEVCEVLINEDTSVTAKFTAIEKWIVETVDNSGLESAYTSITTDLTGNVHISYLEATNNNLMYATNATGSWVTETVDSSGSVGFYAAIATDSSGKVHISYYDWGNYDLKYATNASGSWVVQTIESSGEVGSSTSIAIDSSDHVHISYSDWTNYDLKYATNSSGSWVTQTIDSSGRIAADETTDIAIDSLDNVHISYFDYDNKALKYATNASGSWVVQTIDSEDQAGGSSSIAIDSLDNVHISYGGGYPNYYLKYATNSSGTWVVQTLDNNSWVKSTSIAIDSSDRVHITYTDWLNDDLKYATNASGSWVIEIIDSEGDVGNYPSIALDSSGKVHISYSDWTNDTLKYVSSKSGDNDKYTLIISKSGTGTGTITSSPAGIDCGSVCRESYSQGSIITLTSSPAVNSDFSGWSANGCNSGESCEVTVNADTMVTAVFAVKTNYITATFNAGGTISPGSMAVPYGADQIFAIIPDTGYHITNVLVDGASVGPVTAHTFPNVTSSHTIEAQFTINSYIIAASASPNGSISPSGTVTDNYGASRTFTISPDTDYHIEDVLVDGVSVGAVSSYTFSNITADHLIEAGFAIGTYDYHPNDTNQDRVIGDFELLNAIDEWANGNVGDFDLLNLIDFWAFGSYCWDPELSKFKAGVHDSSGACLTGGIMSGAMSAPAGQTASAVRTVQDYYLPGADVDITLVIALDEFSRPKGILLKEYLPAGWELSSASMAPGNCTPGDINDACTGEIKWLLFDEDIDLVIDTDITYSLTAPEGQSGPQTVNGELNYVYPVYSGTQIIDPIGGDTEIPPCPISTPAKVGSSYYSSVQSAYDAAGNEAVIQVQAGSMEEQLNINRTISVSMEGGYNCDYSEVRGTTKLQGNVTVSDGTVVIENVVIEDNGGELLSIPEGDGLFFQSPYIERTILPNTITHATSTPSVL